MCYDESTKFEQPYQRNTGSIAQYLLTQLPSQGLYANKLVNYNLWLEGPPFLKDQHCMAQSNGTNE